MNSLRAFAAVADTGSYAGAVDHLNFTQAAVSQQVKALESRIGITLVHRVGRGIELTRSGARLARDLEAGFDIISRGVERINEEAVLRPVHVDKRAQARRKLWKMHVPGVSGTLVQVFQACDCGFRSDIGHPVPFPE